MSKNYIFLNVYHFARKNNTENLNKKIKLEDKNFYNIMYEYAK